MARHLFAILDDLIANLAELKAALAPLALIGGQGRVRGQKARLGATSREGGCFTPERSNQRQAPRGDAGTGALHECNPTTLGRPTRASQEAPGGKGSRGCHRARAQARSLT